MSISVNIVRLRGRVVIHPFAPYWHEGTVPNSWTFRFNVRVEGVDIPVVVPDVTEDERGRLVAEIYPYRGVAVTGTLTEREPEVPPARLEVSAVVVEIAVDDGWEDVYGEAARKGGRAGGVSRAGGSDAHEGGIAEGDAGEGKHERSEGTFYGDPARKGRE